MNGVRIRNPWFPYNERFYIEALTPSWVNKSKIAETHRQTALALDGLRRMEKTTRNIAEAESNRKTEHWHQGAQLISAICHERTWL